MKKENKEKKETKSFKELWANPKTNALIKLGLWGIFFIIIYAVILFGNDSNSNNKRYVRSTTTTTTTEVKDLNYSEMKLKLLSKNQEVKYQINDYYITGSISDGELLGTVEKDDIVYKFKYDGEKIYRIKKEELNEDDKVLNDIKREYLLPGKIVEIINDPKNIATINKKEETYSYNYNDIKIIVYLKYNCINRIVINDSNVQYDLEYKEVINKI